VVVELYTAQGCSTCPKANSVVADLEAKKGVLPLTFSVDYWDYLGWADTLAKPEFAERQRRLAERLKVREIYTPEIIVQGEAEAPALDQSKIDALIEAARRGARKGPRVKVLRHGGRVRVGAAAGAGRADVWLVRYDPAPVSVKIKAGENKGRTVTIHNAVTSVVRLGGWLGQAKTYKVPTSDDEGLRSVILVEGVKGGPILASARAGAL
jgi:hypothetical protein